jgi:hypothetical protein
MSLVEVEASLYTAVIPKVRAERLPLPLSLPY